MDKNNEKFVLVKITDKKWANKLLDGEVFMRPLTEFGSGKIIDRDLYKKDWDTLQNHFRGDVLEGVCQTFKDGKSAAKKYNLPDDLVNVINNFYLVDMGEVQYFKLFSLYALYYDDSRKCFLKPNEQLRQFGDTAVIFTDFEEFLRRFANNLGEYPYLFFMDLMKYYKLNEDAKFPPLFYKHNSYSWQNEFRIAFSELVKNAYFNEKDKDRPYKMITNKDRKIFKIGDLRDIAYEIPIGDFLDLKVPIHAKLNSINNHSAFSKIVQDTQREMGLYKPRDFTIGFML